MIGLCLGILSYRSSYAAIFDFRNNHIPLPPHAENTQFFYDRCIKIRANERVLPEINGGLSLLTWSWWRQSATNSKAGEKGHILVEERQPDGESCETKNE